VIRETAEVVAKRLGELPAGTRLLLGFSLPIVAMASPKAGADGENGDDAEDEETQDSKLKTQTLPLTDPITETLEGLRRRGYARLLINGQAVNLDEVDRVALKSRTTLEVVVDRLRIEGDLRSRLTDSIETSYREGGGAAFAVNADTGERLEFSERFECRTCGIMYETPQPRLFSFNNPFGACPTCHGFGNIIELDMELVVPDPSKSINQGAIEPWSKPHYRAQLAELKRAARKTGTRLDVPWSDLTDDERKFVVDGDPSTGSGQADYEGIRGFFRWLERKKYKVHVRVFLSRYRGYLACPDCGGARLRREARNVRVGGRTVDEVSALTVVNAQKFFSELQLSEKESVVADKVLREIRRRLTFLSDVGLDYLTLDRLSSTLSGGESQRINLATSLGSALVGTLYVLDEPSIGLHARDNQRLIDILQQLRDQGNTVLVVEHDEDMIRVADHIVDIGLGAGEQGGRVVYSGDMAGLLQETKSLTAKYLRNELAIPVPSPRRRGTGQKIKLKGAAEHNLKSSRYRNPAEHHHLRDWGERIRQVHAGARRALCGDQTREGRLGSPRRHYRDLAGLEYIT
jgi:excinuclease ABC subunit A